jgi:hypothetical protein
MKIYYRIKTRYGDYYKLDKDGYVLEYSNGLREDEKSDSRKTWQIIGAVFNVGWHEYKISLDEVIQRGDFRLKNGKPRYTLADIDNGTYRIHGNKNYHGVDYIIKEIL